MSAWNFKDLTGMKFGKLTVIERAENPKSEKVCWRCKCECGKETVVTRTNLTSGHTVSCGCLQKEVAAGFRFKHGFAGTKIYRIWLNMKTRCHNPNAINYGNYGGRGIKVCERWLDFQNFYEDVSKLEHFGEEGYSLDRIDNNGNYEPNNVRWASAKFQGRNTRVNNIVEFGCVKMTLIEASELSGIPYATLWARYKKGDRGDKLFRTVKN